MLQLDTQPWWTPADQAELELAARALVLGHEWHLQRCTIATDGWCRHLSAAVQEVIDWRDARMLHSRAQWLRRRQTALEETHARVA